MSNLRICHLNRADAATLAVSPAADADGPVTYLQQDGRGYLMTVTGTSAVISGEWGGTAYTVGCCALYRHNLLTNDTWRLQLYSDAAWTTQVYDSGTGDAFTDGTFDDWAFGFSVMWFAAQAGVKSFKLTVTTSGASVEAGRLVLGPYTEAPYNPSYGLSLGYADNSEIARTGGGTLATRLGEQWRTLACDMMVRTEADRAAWMEIDRSLGASGSSALVSVFPGVGGTVERDGTILGKFTERPAQKFSNFNRYDMRIQLDEV